MFMVSFRLRGRLVAGLLAVTLAATAGIIGVRALRGDDAVTTAGSAAESVSRPKKVKTNEQRVQFIHSFGWEVEEEPAEVMEVIIPKEFDSIYEQYNVMQKKQGYDLSKHAGKRCKRYSYIVTNYPGQSEDVRLNLLVRDNKVIGGDVCSLLADGFIHGFEMPEQPSTAQVA